MAVQPQRQIKVLRIGILQDGKIVQEKRIRPGETVTIGESQKSTFPYKVPKLSSRFQMFVAKGGNYALHFTEAMTGKVAYKDGVSGLEQLRVKGATKRGDVWVLPLDEFNRGKISVDNLTVLFQFVPAPPEPLHPTTRTNFNPRLMDENDPAFFGFFGLYALLALVFVIYVYNAEPVELVTIDEIPERFVELALIQPVEKKDQVDPDAAGKEMETKKEKTESKEDANKTPDKPISAEERAAAEIKRKQALEQAVAEKSLLLKMIGTKGESSSGAVVEDLFGEGDNVGQDLSAALKDVTGGQVGTTDALANALKEGQGAGTGRGDAAIGELAKVDGGKANLGTGPTTKVKGKVTQGEVDASGGDPGQVKRSVSTYNGQVQACYEQQLKDNPALGGRIEISWNIAKGRVTSASVVANGTGSDPLAQCIVRKVKSWRFPETLENVDVVYPFILAPG